VVVVAVVEPVSLTAVSELDAVSEFAVVSVLVAVAVVDKPCVAVVMLVSVSLA